MFKIREESKAKSNFGDMYGKAREFYKPEQDEILSKSMINHFNTI
jgi:hypothetical protein